MLPNATNELLEQMAAQRRQEYLDLIPHEHARFHYLNQVFHGSQDLSNLVPVNTNRTGWDKWLERNKKSMNPFRRAIERLVDPLGRAEMQWTGDEDWSDEQKALHEPLLTQLSDLREQLALALTLHGRAGVFPWRDEQGKLRITALTQFIFPIRDDYEITKFDTVIMFQRYQSKVGAEYMIWQFTDGEMNLWRTPDVTKFVTRGTKETYPQPHAKNRLPIAFDVLIRTPEGETEGLGEAGVSAQEKFLQRVIQENASYERAGHPQRVARGVNPQDEVDSFAAYDVLRLSKPEADIVNLDATPQLERLSQARQDARDEVSLALHAPEVSDGAGESGDARVTSLEEFVTASNKIGSVVARILSDATVLLAGLGELPNALKFSLTPEFEAKRVAEQNSIMALFSTGLISRYQTLLELEKLGVNLDPVELEIALEEREALRSGKIEIMMPESEKEDDGNG